MFICFELPKNECAHQQILYIRWSEKCYFFSLLMVLVIRRWPSRGTALKNFVKQIDPSTFFISLFHWTTKLQRCMNKYKDRPLHSFHLPNYLQGIDWSRVTVEVTLQVSMKWDCTWNHMVIRWASKHSNADHEIIVISQDSTCNKLKLGHTYMSKTMRSNRMTEWMVICYVCL